MRRVRRRQLLGLGLVVVAVAAAVVVAVGPAKERRSTYVWPPGHLATTPSRGWYGPLPLLNRVPEAITVHVPCGVSPALRTTGQATVVSTARHPRVTPALRVEFVGRSLLVGAGRRIVRLPWPESCPVTIDVRHGRIAVGRRSLSLVMATPGHMPIVTGFFSDLNLARGDAPRISLTTRVYATSATTRQTVASVIGALAVLLALISFGSGGGSGRSTRLRRKLRAIRSPDRLDGIVLATLTALWALGPLFPDDGWVRARQGGYAELGGFTNYFDNWGVTLPLIYWVEWLQHWAVASTSQLVFMRLPSAAALAVGWFVARWCLARAVPDPKSRLPVWILAGVFLIGAAAWGMTLRPEPFVALLAGISLSAMFSFAAEPRVGPLAIAAAAVVVAINAHPAGGTVAAPIIACVPAIVGWLRRDRVVRASCVLVIGAVSALAILLFVLGSDFSNRLSDAHLVRSGTLHAEPWWREYIRYESVILDGGNQVRRTSLVLFGVAILLFATRRRGLTSGFSPLAGRTLCVAALLLLATPSKWLWHFGALTIFLAVAAAVEGARLASAEEPNRRFGRPILVFGLVAGLGLWAWGARSGWAALDLMVAKWNYGFSLLSWMITVPGALSVYALVRRRRGLSTKPTGALTAWGLAVFSLLVVWITLAVFAGDALFSQWSPARQYASALLGRSGCGVADRIRVGPARTRLTQLIERPHVTLMDPFISPYFPCAEQPRIDHGLVVTPEHLVAQGTPWPVQVRDGAFEAFFDLYPIEQIAATKRGVRVWRIDPHVDGYERVKPLRVQSSSVCRDSLSEAARDAFEIGLIEVDVQGKRQYCGRGPIADRISGSSVISRMMVDADVVHGRPDSCSWR